MSAASFRGAISTSLCLYASEASRVFCFHIIAHFCAVLLELHTALSRHLTDILSLCLVPLRLCCLCLFSKASWRCLGPPDAYMSARERLVLQSVSTSSTGTFEGHAQAGAQALGWGCMCHGLMGTNRMEHLFIINPSGSCLPMLPCVLTTHLRYASKFYLDAGHPGGAWSICHMDTS